MTLSNLFHAAGLAVVGACGGFAVAQEGVEVALVDAFPAQPKFVRPLLIEYPPADADFCYVVEQGGVVWRLRRDGVGERRPFVDLSKRCLHPEKGGHNEEGLLGLAFDPDYARNREVFLYYSEQTGTQVVESRGRARTVPLRRSVVARMTAVLSDDDWRLDSATELRILEVTQPWGNHNGGTIVFGPDGMLYIALGDGGASDDRGGNGQNLASLLASILRIDVKGASKRQLYRIPPDNPFVGRSGARAEIWAYGLRNPWRITFDRKTGDLWCGDVGQNKFEEVDRIQRGGNYGWPLREAFHEFPPKRNTSDDVGTFIDPIAEYPRNHGVSVTGGYVYRGAEIPALVGHYVYADFATTRIWAVRDEQKGADNPVIEIGRAPGPVASFGEDPAGELCVLCFDGRVYRMR